MKNKAIRIVLAFILLAAGAAGAGSGYSRKNQVAEGVENMKTTLSQIPPIDAAAPLETRTATFALG